MCGHSEYNVTSSGNVMRPVIVQFSAPGGMFGICTRPRASGTISFPSTIRLRFAVIVSASWWTPRGGDDDREPQAEDRKSTRLNSSHTVISYAVFCLKKKKS